MRKSKRRRSLQNRPKWRYMVTKSNDLFGDRIALARTHPHQTNANLCTSVGKCSLHLLALALFNIFFFCVHVYHNFYALLCFIHFTRCFYHLNACVDVSASLNRRQLDFRSTWNFYQYTWWCLSAEFYSSRHNAFKNECQGTREERHNTPPPTISHQHFHIDKKKSFVVVFDNKNNDNNKTRTHARNARTILTIQFEHNIHWHHKLFN